MAWEAHPGQSYFLVLPGVEEKVELALDARIFPVIDFRSLIAPENFPCFDA